MQTNFDTLIYSAMFAQNKRERKKSSMLIRQLAEGAGIYSASTYNLYKAAADGTFTGVTIPAINMRTLTYDFARVIFQVARENNVSAFIFELSRFEMWFTDQTPDEFVVSILAAALAEGYTGPVFLQGDHFQFNAKRYRENPDEEIGLLKKLIDESLAAHIYNIDIDASTLVNLSVADLDEQQKENYTNTALLASYIRKKEPSNVTVAIGAEIGHIGERNSTVADMIAFMRGFAAEKKMKGLQGLSKLSVATGTTHGGVLLPDGKIAAVALDFSVLHDITKVCREEYGIGGTVQHGASTLSKNMFALFPQNDTLEIHLASSFSNIVFDHMPDDLRDEIYHWMEEHMQSDWDPKLSRQQFLYTHRKKALGKFKKKIWDMSEERKKIIRKKLEKEVEFLFKNLNVFDTYSILSIVH